MNKHEYIFDAPRLLVVTDKHDMRYFHIPNSDVLNEVAIGLVRERHADGWYENSEDLQKTLADSTRAMDFLRSRNGTEYKCIELITYEREP